MKSLVIYYSKYGNTKIIAETIASELAPCGPVRLVDANQLAAADFSQVELVVMGTPTHRMKLPVEVRAIFEQLPHRLIKKIPVAVFDTSYPMPAWLSHFTASHRLVHKLRRLGGMLVVPPKTFKVASREGPLCQGEEERAKAWAGLILSKLPGSG